MSDMRYEYMAQLTDQNEDKRDSPALTVKIQGQKTTHHLQINEQISILEVEAAVKKLRNGKSPSQII